MSVPLDKFDDIDWAAFEDDQPGDHRERRDSTALVGLGMHAREMREDLRKWLQDEIVELRGAIELWSNDPSPQNEMVKHQHRYWLTRLQDMEKTELVDAVQEANRREEDLIEKSYRGYDNVSEAFLFVADCTYRFGVMTRELAKLRKMLEGMKRL